jgi:hypothetical protein
MKCNGWDCDKELTGGLDTFGLPGEPLCWNCYATRNAEAGEAHYGLGPHVHEVDSETGQMTTMFLQKNWVELVDDGLFMPDPDAPGCGVWTPTPLPGWR